MLSRANRLSLKTDRFRIERDGKTFHSPLFTYLVTPREGSSLPIRFAILVSKKNTPLSINRHRLRRHLTEILRHHLDQLPPGLDIILIPKRNIGSASPTQILSDLTKMINV